ncbi:hypothetical protein GGR57DRAFT_463577 [Xylariaceae sp. FL1272]|nr:hypothetical protein GGR57DRAFT_463577 [Xylariaceae sp. FL1272]
MNKPWLRAIRSTALNPRFAQNPPRSTRVFHTSFPRRWPSDSGNNPSGDGNKPDDASGSGKPLNTEDKLFEDTSSAAAAEGLGRKRPAAGLRSRAQRNRKSELPAVQIPQSFLDLSITRHEDIKTGNLEGQEKPSISVDESHDELRQLLEQDPDSVESASRRFIDVLSPYTSVTPTHTAQRICAELDFRHKYLNILTASSILALESNAQARAESKPLDPAHTELLYRVSEDSGRSPASDWMELWREYRHPSFETVRKSPLLSRLAFEQSTRGKINESDFNLVRSYLPGRQTLFLSHGNLLEITLALHGDLSVQAPKDIRLSSLHRPVTIIDMPDCTGYSLAKSVVHLAAKEVGADVLHLRAADIAHIVGSYLNQDVTRTPGDISLLGYKAAENASRIKLPQQRQDEPEAGEFLNIPVSITVRGQRSRDEMRRQTLSMDEYLLNSGTRGKSDELWEEMKINAALDELVHSADLDGVEQKPLLVHLHDYNSIEMDSDYGSAIIAKLRKIVDELWTNGRRIALVGTCSSKDTSNIYRKSLADLEKTDRVIRLCTERDISAIRKSLDETDKRDSLRENDENLVRVLQSLSEASTIIQSPLTSTLGLCEKVPLDRHGRWPGMSDKLQPSNILPLTEIYRIATTMFALATKRGDGVLNYGHFEAAMALLSKSHIYYKSSIFGTRESDGSDRDSSQTASSSVTQRNNPYQENHEEKLLSGLVKAEDMRTTFKDIHAPKETLDSIKMLTTLSLVRPEAFSYGVLASDRIPGCLLYGPPGTGKTLLAKAVAKESGANMIEVSGASINAMWVGESEKNVRALFRLAKKKEPMVIFIDEADALLGARGGGRDNGGRRQTINQFLREWDGMDRMKAFIMVATNRPFDLDEAVLRRLPRKILVDLPLEADRAAILGIHLKDEQLDDTVSLEELAKQTPLYSGSDLKNMCVAAAMAAVKEELDAFEAHKGPEEFVWAQKRVLNRRHFDKGLKEIGASVSEDMETLTAIRKFDQRYGDGKEKKKRKGMGFEVVPDAKDSEGARVRKAPAP